MGIYGVGEWEKVCTQKKASEVSRNSLTSWPTHERAICNQLLNLQYVLFT